MSKINILPAQVYNRIAAGEVVERPFSVVKELIENAIDAGATEIQIFVEGGGKQLIRIVDNGSGIERDDLHAAFLPHATSKIAKASDLESILTLGFRGEAVASIASVSKMTITSKTEDGGCFQLFSNGGELGEILPAAGDKGTEVKVEMLFFNTPARFKFLKSDKAEEADITTCISRFILSHADISFTYYLNGKKVLQSFGGGKKEALVGVYGAAILNNVYEIDAVKHGLRIRGYIGNQNFFKPNKSYQSVFLNGRYVVNDTVSAAITGAYASYLMKRQYPFYVLYIDVPPAILDVNVTPNKTDVRFADNKMIYGCIYSVIAAVLDGHSSALDYLVEEKKVIEPAQAPAPKALSQKPAHSFVFPVVDAEDERKPVKEAPAKKVVEPPFTEVKSEEPAKKTVAIPKSIYEPGSDILGALRKIGEAKSKDTEEECVKQVEAAEELRKKFFPELYFERNHFRVEDKKEKAEKEKPAEETDIFAENKRLLEQMEEKRAQTKIEFSSSKFVGKLFNTYLIYERASEAYLIDQHAAHERLIFDRLKEKMDRREKLQQPLLVPFTLEINAFEAAFIRDKMPDICALGFDMEEFGQNSFKVSAVPVDLQTINLSVFFNELLGDLHGLKGIKLTELLRDKLAMAACKSAVKGGMDLSQAEIDELFRLMDGNAGLKCPHGRPVVVKLTKKEIEKMFKRIV